MNSPVQIQKQILDQNQKRASKDTPLEVQEKFNGANLAKADDLECLMGLLFGIDAEGDLVGDADAVAFEGDDFFGVIG